MPDPSLRWKFLNNLGGDLVTCLQFSFLEVPTWSNQTKKQCVIAKLVALFLEVHPLIFQFHFSIFPNTVFGKLGSFPKKLRWLQCLATWLCRLPLCLLRDLSKLAFSSLFGLACDTWTIRLSDWHVEGPWPPTSMDPSRIFPDVFFNYFVIWGGAWEEG